MVISEFQTPVHASMLWLISSACALIRLSWRHSQAAPHWMMLHPRERWSTDTQGCGCLSHSDWATKFLNLHAYNSVVSLLVCDMNKQDFLNVILVYMQVKEEFCLGMWVAFSGSYFVLRYSKSVRISLIYITSLLVLHQWTGEWIGTTS